MLPKAAHETPGFSRQTISFSVCGCVYILRNQSLKINASCQTLKTNTCKHFAIRKQIMQSGNPPQTGQGILQAIDFLKLKA